MLGSIYTIHHDKTYWLDADTFKIGRWIDENGELVSHEDHFMPFSTGETTIITQSADHMAGMNVWAMYCFPGKRMCVGKQLATIELQLYLVKLIQRFKFQRAEPYERFTSINDDEYHEGVLRSPHDFHFRVIPR